jgi:hypothetical protein
MTKCGGGNEEDFATIVDLLTSTRTKSLSPNLVSNPTSASDISNVSKGLTENSIKLIQENILRNQQTENSISELSTSISEAAGNSLEDSFLEKSYRLQEKEKEEYNNTIKKRLFLKYLSIDYGRINSKDIEFRS